MKEAFKIHEVVSVRMPCGQEGHKGLLLGMMGFLKGPFWGEDLAVGCTKKFIPLKGITRLQSTNRNQRIHV